MLKSNPRVVFRARIEPDPGSEQLDAYWVGRRFDRFDGVEWSSSGRPGARRCDRWCSGAREPGLVRQDIDLLPAYGSRTLVALDTPVAFGDAELHQPTFTMRTELVPSGDREVRLTGSLRARHLPRLQRRSTGPRHRPWPTPSASAGSSCRLGSTRASPRSPTELAAGATGDRAVARQLERALQTGYALHPRAARGG